MIIAFETDASEDLRPLAGWLRKRGVPHRVFEEGGRLRVAVPEERFIALVGQGAARFQAGELETVVPSEMAASPVGGIRQRLAQAPVTALFMGLALLLFPATAIDLAPLEVFTLRWLMIVPIERVGDFIDFSTLGSALRAGEIWRLWTPAFLHFGAVHLTFNLLWLWEFGRRIETAGGRGRLVEAVLVLAPLANIAQYLMDDGPRFGGLSGVVYGLLGFLIVAGRRSSEPAYKVPAALVLVLVVFLVFFTTGATETFGLFVANGAHWGGFVGGMLLAMLRVRADSAGGDARDREAPGPSE